MRVADLIKHVGVLPRHFSHDDIGDIDLPIDSLEDALAKQLFVYAFRGDSEFCRWLLDAELARTAAT